MALIPGLQVAPPEPLRSRYGLFTAASGPLDLPAPHGEGGGIRYVPTTCGGAYAYGVHCYDQDNPAPDKPHDPDNPEVQTGVFLALSTLECTQVGYTEAQLRAKVTRRLEASEQATVEAALWSGLDLDGNPLGIQNLDDEAEAVPGGYDPDLITDVIGALERYAYTDQGYGYAATIHAPIEVAAFATEAGLVLQDGPRKVTPLGSVWAFGAYPMGEVIVTGQTTLWRAQEVQLLPAFDTRTNLRLLVAERAWAASFDCLAGRATFDPLGS
ncbi:hypothetical protein [Actinoplanes sp. NPDC026619]|uniref:hypothetical protein n=1 Tax=Actinoplanes sp. NPDC026619 TaxID=3155798 RepID=UPI0033C3BC5B